MRSALIPARTAHQVVADGRMVFFYIDPSAVSAERVRDQMLGHTATISYQHQAESSLISAWQDTAEPDPETLWRYLDEAAKTGAMDERIRTAMRLLRSRPNENAKDIAAAVNLSSSQFLRLFALHAGTSFRRYRLWAKMCRAADAVSNGADLTTASTEAGFASPSHFSDAFRAMFGLSATQLMSGPTRIIVADSKRAGLGRD
ncbi:AraC family transcriptional regulator [Aeromicrobium sp.]|uniref:AraC family transcriptional regulator n=1 Tax=Aeromicrobium sp. TaxID=1871063 RepID=UPI002FCA230F